MINLINNKIKRINQDLWISFKINKDIKIQKEIKLKKKNR